MIGKVPDSGTRLAEAQFADVELCETNTSCSDERFKTVQTTTGNDSSQVQS